MNANGFTAIWFILLKQSKQGGETLNMMSWNIIAIYIWNGNYSQWLHTLWTMGPPCHARLLHESVASSSASDQLLILLPAYRAGPSPLPGWPHFPQSPGTFLLLCWLQFLLQYVFGKWKSCPVWTCQIFSRYTFIDYTLPVGLDVSQWITKERRNNINAYVNVSLKLKTLFPLGS